MTSAVLNQEDARNLHLQQPSPSGTQQKAVSRPLLKQCSSPEPEPAEVKKRHEVRKKRIERKESISAYEKVLQWKESKKELEIHAPELMDVGDRSEIQTELYLEEISNRIITVDTECQTDVFIERPPTPVFIPQKSGADVATQIEEGELFNFDIEVKPMLEVLVGKTLEQALLEVMEEEDLNNLLAHQYAYLELRNAEKAEMQRLEEEERRHNEEKERRKAQQYKILEKRAMVSNKVAAQIFSFQYLEDLIPSAFFSLRNKGFFYDEIQRDIEKRFLPYVMVRVERRLQKKLLGRIMLDYLINKVVRKRLERFEENQLLQKYHQFKASKIRIPPPVMLVQEWELKSTGLKTLALLTFNPGIFKLDSFKTSGLQLPEVFQSS
ncbi:radial spoke head protein 3 homolog [Erythrolamprus reginae]|uniref:radial spoke head protein 3 homolog n=1 Tax=Erythrolamprus reginae TaxID=121349 RepID=UPI00396C89F9